MNNKDELLFAIREARRDLKDGRDYRADEMLTLLEGMAPFLDKDVVLGLKCRSCDFYADSSFPLTDDYWAVDKHEYCHAHKVSLQNLNLQKAASCNQHSRASQEALQRLSEEILEEDLVPAFSERKLYDRNLFASYNVTFNTRRDQGKVCIEFGHSLGGDFVGSDLKLDIITRLDPGFGPEGSKRIAEALKEGRPLLVVNAGSQTRRLLDIDYVLEWIAKKRKMDIVYL